MSAIIKGFEETAFTITESPCQLTYLALPAVEAPAQDKPSIQAEDTNIQPEFPLAPLKKRQLDEFIYDLWYRRLNHLGPAVIIRANKIAIIKEPIPIARVLGRVYNACAKAKITDGRNLRVSERKPGILHLVSFDVCGPLLLLRLGYEYFLLLINNYSRFNWVRPIKTRDDCYAVLDSWKLSIECRTDKKLRAVRLDNTPELLKQVKK